MLFEKPRTMSLDNKTYWVQAIDSQCTHDLILNRHYAHRLPSITFAFALMSNDGLEGVVTFGAPASPYLCAGVCGQEHKTLVVELNRLVLKHNKKNLASFLVGRSLRLMPPRIVVSYADTEHGHIGYVYQSTNFLFTGTTKERTDMATINGGHSRHNAGDSALRMPRSAKHRYVTFTGPSSFRNNMKRELRYQIMPYPKRQHTQEDRVLPVN